MRAWVFTLIEDMKLLDLRNDKNAKTILRKFSDVCKEKSEDKNVDIKYRIPLKQAFVLIRTGKIKSANISEAIGPIGKYFSDYVKSLDYDGLIAIEGGEGDEIGNHDSYVIFDPNEVKIGREQKLKKESGGEVAKETEEEKQKRIEKDELADAKRKLNKIYLDKQLEEKRKKIADDESSNVPMR